MNAHYFRNGLIGAAAGVLFALCVFLVAVADPGGWEAWRVGLACSPAVFIGLILGATFP